ncbi:MAG: hypothetical protein ACYCUM_13865 [Solirubrobacteraceae bacterium]
MSRALAMVAPGRGTLALFALAAIVLAALLPLIAAGGVVSAFAGSGCPQSEAGEPAAGAGPVAAGMYARALQLQQGHVYEVGATRYGGPEDPSSGDYGAIGNPSENYLPEHPDSFAELSVLAANPANGASFTFADANALNNLPYMTGLRVSHDGHEEILYKRDIGYGQGPGQTIANGEPYRLDIWWQAAEQLDVSKSAVRIELAPQSGTAQTLGETTEEDGASEAQCAGGLTGEELPLPLAPGTQTKILPDGLAAAGREAPAQVKEMVAAGNRLYGTSYLYGGAHGVSLNTLQPAYDCSSSVSYLLHAAGLLGQYAEDSGELASYGESGPGRYVTIYANAEHVFIYVAGLRFDTVGAPYDEGPNANQEGPRWRVYPSVPDWSTWSVRHPPGL